MSENLTLANKLLNQAFAEVRPLKRLLLAVSGGRDSATLLRLLKHFQSSFAIDLAVCHIDHSLRESSKRDAEFVEELASELSLPFYLETLDGNTGDKNLEAWAREERYKALARIKDKSKSDAIVTAHHSGDQAETILFRILTGRTPKGMQIWCSDRKIFRPMLNFSVELIDKLSIELGDSFVEDETNFDLNRSRSKLRHKLLPQLRDEYNPRIDQALVQLAERFTEVESSLDQQAREIWQNKEDGFLLEELASYSESVRWRCLREQAAEEVGEKARGLKVSVFKEVNQLLDQDLGFGISVTKDKQGRIKFFRRIGDTNSYN